MTSVAVLGTGIMGAAMARSLQREGLQVRAWNRTPATAAPLADDGITVCGSAAEAVAGVDVVLTMLYDTDAVLEVMTPLVADLGDVVWVQASTIGLEGTARVRDLADAHGVALLDAPVLGTRAPAEKGMLVVVVSGDRSLGSRVAPVLDAVGSRTMWVGDEPGTASRLKLVVNAWVASINAAVGQSVALAEGLGLDPQLFLDAIGGGPTDTPYAQLKGTMMIAADYPTAFALDNVRKDLGLITAAAVDADVDQVVLDALSALYAKASDRGRGSADMSAVHDAFPGAG